MADSSKEDHDKSNHTAQDTSQQVPPSEPAELNDEINESVNSTPCASKDDSGIVLEKSPYPISFRVLTNNDGDVSKSLDLGTTSTETNETGDAKVSNGAMCEAAADGDSDDDMLDAVRLVEEGGATGGTGNTETRSKRSFRNRNRTNPLSDSSRDSGSGDRQMENGNGIDVNNMDDSDSSDDSSSMETSETKSNDEHDEEYATADELLVQGLPSDAWKPLREILSREKGYSNRMYSDYRLRRKVGGSVSLVTRLKLHDKLDAHDGCVNSLHFNQRGTLLASGSDDLNIIVWDWANSKPYFSFESGHRSNVFQSKFMPYTSDSLIVSCGRDGNVRLAELSSTGSCRSTKKLAQHRGAAHKLALQDDSSHTFYSCGEDGVTYEIDLRESKPNRLHQTKENDRKIPLYSIHSHPFKSYEFCVSGRDQYIRIYDARMLQNEEAAGCLKKFCPQHLVNCDIKANVTCAVYSWNGSEIIGTYNDEDIYLFDTSHSDGASFTHSYKGHRNNATVKGVNFYGPHSEFIVSGSDCGNVFLWEKKSESIVNYLHADDGGVVNVLEPHPHDPYLATSGLDHDVKIFLPTREVPTKLEGLTQVKRRNAREREDERSGDPAADLIDSHMVWMFLQRLRRSARRQDADGEELTPTSSDGEDSDYLEDDDQDDGPPQCTTS